jgi:uncharacterized protein YjbJ (UPF0337 family)
LDFEIAQQESLNRRSGMDKDRIKGSGDQMKGKIKEGAGKLTGDEKLKNEGRADQVKGKVENAVGGAKDKVREAIDND